MYFLVDNKRKFIFGWSAKCGCSHIKRIFYFIQNGEIENEIHLQEEYQPLKLKNLKGYHVFLFIRNPFERVVSGFLDKYNYDHIYYKNFWNKNTPLTFTNFVNELIKGDYQRVEKHHFTPQLSETWTNKISNHDRLYIFDIASINYAFIENIINLKIPQELKDFRGGHENRKPVKDQGKVAHLQQKDYKEYRPEYHNFYTNDLLIKITLFYSKDLLFFKEKGFTYKI